MLYCIGVSGKRTINELYPYNDAEKFYILDTDDLRIEKVSSNTIHEALNMGVHIIGCKIDDFVDEDGNLVKQLHILVEDVYTIFGGDSFLVGVDTVLAYFSTGGSHIELSRLDVWYEGYYYQFTRRTINGVDSQLLVNGVEILYEEALLILLHHIEYTRGY